MNSEVIQRNENGHAIIPGKAWGMLVLTLLVTITIPLNMFKCPGLAGSIIGYYGIDPSAFGWSMSIFTVMGIVLAFPASAIISKIGSKAAVSISVAFTVVGSIIGAVSTDFTMFLAARFLEGVGMGLVAVAAPAVLTRWFPRHKRGLAIGIWSPWVPIGSIVMLNASNPLASAFGGWQGAWWFGAIYGIVMLILWIIFFKEPEVAITDADEFGDGESECNSVKDYKKPILCGSMWAIAISFCIFNICQNGTINTFYTTYLTTIHGFDDAMAAFATSVITILAIPSAILGGFLADKFKTRRWLIVAGYCSIIIATIWLFNWTETWQLYLCLFICGLFPSFATTNVFASAGELMKPGHVPLGAAIIAFMQNIGSFIGGIALGYMYVPMGWAMASYVLFFPLLIVAVLLAVFTKKLR